MTKKQLNEYKWLKKNIATLNKTLQELRLQAECKSPTLSYQPKSTDKKFDQIPALVVDIVETEQLLIQKIKEAHKALELIENAIEVLPECERHLMRLRYIEDMRWEKICVEISYSLRQTHNVHRRALKLMLKDCTK